MLDLKFSGALPLVSVFERSVQIEKGLIDVLLRLGAMTGEILIERCCYIFDDGNCAVLWESELTFMCVQPTSTQWEKLRRLNYTNRRGDLCWIVTKSRRCVHLQDISLPIVKFEVT